MFIILHISVHTNVYQFTVCVFVYRDNEKESLDLKWQFEGHKLGVISVDIEKKEGRCKYIYVYNIVQT